MAFGKGSVDYIMDTSICYVMTLWLQYIFSRVFQKLLSQSYGSYNHENGIKMMYAIDIYIYI